MITALFPERKRVLLIYCRLDPVNRFSRSYLLIFQCFCKADHTDRNNDRYDTGND